MFDSLFFFNGFHFSISLIVKNIFDFTSLSIVIKSALKFLSTNPKVQACSYQSPLLSLCGVWSSSALSVYVESFWNMSWAL